MTGNWRLEIGMKVVEDLEVYSIALSVAENIYKITQRFPKDELYGLVSQMRRAAISINSNLSEGGARLTDGEKRHFVGIARGSAAELRFQVVISEKLGFISKSNAENLITDIDRIRRMLSGLLKYLTPK